MGAGTPRAIAAAIREGRFAAAYYIHGDDEHRKLALVHELTTAAVDVATREFNFDTLRGGEVSAEQLGSILNTPPMMASRRVVVLRDTASLKKDARGVLESYLAKPSLDTLLVMVALAGSKAETTLSEHCVTVQLDGLGEEELPVWIADHVQRVHGTTITSEALALLPSWVKENTGLLVSELDKLASYARGEGSAIDDDAVAAVVGVRRGETLSDLLDSVAARDGLRALALVEHVLQQPKTTAVSVIMALTVQMLALAWGRAARDRGLAAHQLEREYFGLLKETGAFPMRPWGEATKCWAKHLAKWDARAIERALDALRWADQSAKDTRLSSDEQLMSTLVSMMCSSEGRREAA